MYGISNVDLTDAGSTRYPIPIRILNINANSDSRPSDSSEFQRRFTLVNTLVGKESGTLKYVRFPVSLQMWFRKAVSMESGKISVPILDIKYLDYPIADLSSKSVSVIIINSFRLQAATL